MISFPVLLGYLLVSLLWGCSNPFIKHAQVITSQRQAAAHKGGEDEADKGHTRNFFQTLLSGLRTFQDLRVLIPFLVNQTGSLVFFFLLSSEPVSIASPVCNSLTFVVTAVTSYAVFNEVVRYPVLLIVGTMLIVCGTYFCLM
eukprot:gene2902-3168_t